MIDVQLSPESQARFDALIASFEPGGSKARAITEGGVRALNHAGNSARRVVVHGIAQQFGIHDGDVRPYVPLKEATADQPEARLFGYDRKKTKGIPIIALGARGPEPSRGKGNGVTYRGGTLPHAFIATMRNRKRAVMQRRGTKRTPIDQQFTPSVRVAFGAQRAEGIAAAQAVLDRELSAEIAHALQSA